MLDGAFSTLELGGVRAGAYHTNIALHMQLKGKPFVELLKPFAPSPFVKLANSPITAVASIIRWAGRRITIDGWGQLANGIFLRVGRDSPG